MIEHARLKYACRKDGMSTIRTAWAQPSPLPKSNAGASVLAQILTATFVDHLPLYCQERAWARAGVAFPRSTLCAYKLGATELLAVLLPALRAHVLAAPRVHVDDTTLPLIEGGRGLSHRHDRRSVERHSVSVIRSDSKVHIGTIVRLNQKTATIACSEGEWRVSYALLHRVVDL